MNPNYLDPSIKEAQVHSQLKAKFAEIRETLEGSAAFLPIFGLADSIKVDCATKVRDIDAVARGHAVILPDAKSSRLETLIEQFVTNSSLYVGGDTESFSKQLKALAAATLEDQKANVSSSPEIKEKTGKLEQMIHTFLEGEEGKNIIEKAAEHKRLLLDYRSTLGHCQRVELDPFSPENKKIHALRVLNEIANRRESEYY